MLISVLSVDVSTKPTAKGSYQQAEVAYRDGEGKVGSKKLMSFTNKDVFELMANAKQGESYDIGLTKGEKYWEWTSAKKATAANNASNSGSNGRVSATPSSAATTNSRGFETPEERAKKQVYIIRQSSLSTAVQVLAAGRKTAIDVKEVIEVAQQLESYVLGLADTQAVVKQDVGTIESIDEDIPF